jgi:lysophospholipase L1-like esterase
MILALEVGLRIAAFAWYHHSEYHLFYGFHKWVGRVGIDPWSTIDGEYYKFPPNYILKGANGQGLETAAINSHGFRGPEFETVKPRGVFRVVCLGESSTFGYHDRDDETYPFALGRLFAQEKLRVEVINAGFPYYNSGSILSLLKQEILNYDPDLITLYAGFNDAGWPIRIGPIGHVALWLQSHSITYLLLREQMSSLAFRAELKVLGKVMPQMLSGDRLQLQKNSQLVAERYQENVRSIVRIAKSRGIWVVLIKQPITAHEHDYISLSYEQEYRSVRDKFEGGGSLPYIDILILRQHRLMEEIEEIAREEKLPVVDNIRIVDQDRRRLTSWVHLTGEANLRLAEALEPVIKPYVLRAQDSVERGVVRPSR